MPNKILTSVHVRWKKSPFLRGSTVVLIGTLIASVLNYLYQFSMSSLLSKEDFGVLATLFQLVYLAQLPLPTFQTAMVKTISTHIASKPTQYYLFKKLSRSFLLMGMAIFVVLLLVSPLLQAFLHLSSIIPLLLIAGYAFFSFSIPVNGAFLQGHMRFKRYALIAPTESILKLIIALLLVFWGFGLDGAVLSLFIAIILTYITSLLLVRYMMDKSQKTLQVPLQDLKKNAVTYFLAIASLSLCYSMDVLLVKHFFPHNLALVGDYGLLSLLAKILLWLTIPLVSVMFPFSARVSHHTEQGRRLLKKTLGLFLLITTPILCCYWIAPDFIITTFFKKYSAITSLLGPMGLAMFFTSISFILLNYHLARGRNSIFIFPLIFLIVEVVGIILFHENIQSVVTVVLASMTTLLAVLCVFSFYTKTKEHIDHEFTS